MAIEDLATIQVIPGETITMPEPSSGGGTKNSPGSAACLVVIYTQERLFLGKRFVLENNPTRVGRSTDNHIVLDSSSVSRQHGRFEHRAGAWIVVDDGSTNGTECNDERISRELALKNGDRVKIGPTIFKYLSGADVEAQYHEELYQMNVIDGLTQIHNERYLYGSLEREILLARRHERDLSLLRFDIDHFQRVNDVHGPLAGDFVLKEVTRIVQGRIRQNDVFARYGVDEFAIILPETSTGEAARLGEVCRQDVHAHAYVFQASTIHVAISVGVALLKGSDETASDVIKRAGEWLFFAKNSGRNRVCAPGFASYGSQPIPSMSRRHIDGASLLEKALTKEPPGVLLAFEIDEEAVIVERLGTKVREAWFQQLTFDVGGRLDAEDTLAVWRGRYVLGALRDGNPEKAVALAGDVRAIWGSHSTPAEHRSVPRRLRYATMNAQDLATHRERALDVLVGQLSQRAPSIPPLGDDLPFPIAALNAMVSARKDALGRVKALLDGIEKTLRFSVAIAVGLLRDGGSTQQKERCGEVLVRAARFGPSWEYIAPDLMALITDGLAGEAAVAMRALGHVRRKDGSNLAQSLFYVRNLRGIITRQTGLSEDAYEIEEPRLQEILALFLAALAPLSRLRLVSVAEIESIEDDDSFRYALYLHRGAGEQFPITRVRLPHRLQKNWCYLLAEDPDRPPLFLAPVVLSRTCEVCGRIEVAIAEQLVMGPGGSRVSTGGVITNHGGSIELPGPKMMKGLYESVLAAEARLSRALSENGPWSDGSPDGPTLNGSEQSPWAVVPPPPSTLPHPPLRPVTVLFLGANPSDTTRLALDREQREVTKRVRATPHGSRFGFAHEWAVRVGDLQESLLRHTPDVVHFSGHGSSTGQLLLEDDRGRSFQVEPEALGKLFGILDGKAPVRCVVLNACYSAVQAAAIAEHVDCVVAMSTSIGDVSAISFAEAFYQAIGFGRSLRAAFDLGCSQIDLKALGEADVPRLFLRQGVAAEGIYLIGPAPR